MLILADAAMIGSAEGERHGGRQPEQSRFRSTDAGHVVGAGGRLLPTAQGHPLRFPGARRCWRLDLFVVVDDDTLPERLSWRGKYDARKTYHRTVDIVACRVPVFERKRSVVGSLSHIADQEGVVVYERH